tara:strand:- start:10031 stop:10948 length:918 start_codon:yes stop_codon:yes gene_type:complete
MGLLGTTSQETYNNSKASKAFGADGHYQFVTLEDIINSFMVVYVGESKILNKASRTDVQFHGMRAIQELSYDVLRSHKAYEIDVPNTLVMYLPQDYVNYTKLVRVDSNGIERPLYPTSKTSNPFPIAQDPTTLAYTFASGELLEEGNSSSASNPHNSDARTRYSTQTPTDDVYSDDSTDLEIDNRGRRYGLDPQHAQQNGTFYIDNATGFIHFGSSLAGETVILKYISDGLGQDNEMIVHKFCEEAVYKHIMYGLISSRSNIPEGVIQRFKREKFATTRNAKIRLSNIKMEEFVQILKGVSKPIK